MQTLFSEDKPMAKKTTKKKTTKKARRKKKAEQPMTTAQQLGSLIKSARDIMRKDKGLNGDLDRLPMLTWIMFLKFLDDMEQVDEEATKLDGKRYKRVIESPYRWRDWAAKADGITGDELIAFVNQEEAVRPDGSKGPGLLAYLRSLQSSNGKNRRDVVAQVFSGVVNRMISGYLLRDVINKVDGIHFSSSEELHTLGALYESMLREMRDAAGDSGEFYTPRAVVQFMVAATNPQLGETVLDPACGTGGFLAEAYEHLAKQVETTKHRRVLQEQSLHGQEAKPLPYMLSQMNLLLHGLEYPSIAYGNTLARKVTEIGDGDRFDVILTNPPFGGEEEAGIKNNFPADKQTSETALLFLQLIMRLLKRPEKNKGVPGRAAVVVPNSVLADNGVASRIKLDLLSHFRLHTIVRLPNGVFSPYTPIPTNILFFDRDGPTESIWYYEVPIREGMREFTKTMPLKQDDLADLYAWWNDRKESERAWVVEVSSALAGEDIDLDIPNPHAPPAWGQRDANEMATAFTKRLSEVTRAAEEMPSALSSLATISQSTDVQRVPLAAMLTECRETVNVDPTAEYPNFGIFSFGRGTFEKSPIIGLETSATTLHRVPAGAFIYSRLFAFEGAFALVPANFDGWFVSNEYPAFACDTKVILPEYLLALFRSPETWQRLRGLSKGLGHRRQRVQPGKLLSLEIPLPSIDCQRLVAAMQGHSDSAMKACDACQSDLQHLVSASLSEYLPSCSARSEIAPE